MNITANTHSEDEDIQITKVVSAKKPISWVASSFDSFGLKPQSQHCTPYSKTALSHPPSSSAKAWSKKFSGSQNSSMKTSVTDALPRKRPREAGQRHPAQQSLFQTKSTAKTSESSELWSDKYAPRCKDELAVHKKKVEEISNWLENSSVQCSKGSRTALILLLTGPPGAGKTACIRVLCRETGFIIQEWSSTSDQAADQWSMAENRTVHSQVDVYQSQSQSAVFNNFLLRANKYHALDLAGEMHRDQGGSAAPGLNQSSQRKTVIVVEEVPNIFYRDAAQFHDCLRKYKRCGKSPLVFILSDSNNNSSGIQNLFPKDLVHQLHITNICMNPVAPTMLVKLLTRVANSESGKFRAPSTAVIESVAVASGGDIRSALNTLQFACRRDTLDLKAVCLPPAKPALKKQSSSSGARLKYSTSRRVTREDKDQDQDHASALGVKDKAVFLFQSVGKILHFKRGHPAEHTVIPALPSRLSHFDRDPLLVDPEEVASKSQLSGDYLTSFLHENYVEFLSTVEDLQRAAMYFSDADYLSALWTAREELQSYSVSVAMRGFVHSNSEITRHDSPRRSHGWLPLHKSRWFSTHKQANENITSARHLFKGYHWEPKTLCTEILPFISLTNPTLHDPGQISFVQEMTMFSRSAQVSRSHLERLNEKDVLADEEDEKEDRSKNSVHRNQVDTEEGTDLLGSQSKIQLVQKDELESEEDFDIEEFEDDDDFEDFMFP